MSKPKRHFEPLLAALCKLCEPAVVTDRVGNLCWSNDAFAKLTGWTRQELDEGNPALHALGVHTGRTCAAMWRSVLSASKWSGEVRAPDTDGNQHPVFLQVIPLCDQNRRTTHLVAVYSPRNAGEHTQRESLQALERAMAAWQHRDPEPAIH